MDAEIKAKWLAALRSGEYEQARETLFFGKALCCIGVGVVAAGKNVREFTTTTAARELGLGRTAEEKLIDMNDDEGKSFAEIADYIEANL